MNHFYQDSHQNWWFIKVRGDSKIREIAVSDDMLKALKRYRLSRGLTPLPLPADSTPLLITGRGKALIYRVQIIWIIQECFNKAIELLQKDNLISEAENMEGATLNWLRHTGISDDINKRGRPIEHVQDDAGHNTYYITRQYIDDKRKKR